MQATRDGEDILVTFEWPGESSRLGMRFDVSKAPYGPSTGEVCDSPEDWATEVRWVLMEELETGLTQRAPRTVTRDGVIELDWRYPFH